MGRLLVRYGPQYAYFALSVMTCRSVVVNVSKMNLKWKKKESIMVDQMWLLVLKHISCD